MALCQFWYVFHSALTLSCRVQALDFPCPITLPCFEYLYPTSKSASWIIFPSQLPQSLLPSQLPGCDPQCSIADDMQHPQIPQQNAHSSAKAPGGTIVLQHHIATGNAVRPKVVGVVHSGRECCKATSLGDEVCKKSNNRQQQSQGQRYATKARTEISDRETT